DEERDQSDEGRDTEHVAMGEVHHADDAEHHRVADGDEPIDRAERDPVDQLLDEHFHASAAPLRGSPHYPGARAFSAENASTQASRQSPRKDGLSSSLNRGSGERQRRPQLAY